MTQKKAETEEPAPQIMPAPQEVVTKTPMPSDVVKHPDIPKQRRFIMLIIMALVLILVAGSLVTFAVLSNSPEARLANALSNLRDADSVKTTISADIDDGSGTTVAVEGSVAIVVDPLQLQLEGELDLFLTRLKAEALYIDGNYYVQVSGLDGLESLLVLALAGGSQDLFAADATSPDLTELLDGLGTLVEELDGQWIEIQGSVATQARLDIDKAINGLDANIAGLEDIEDAFTIQEVFEDTSVQGVNASHMRLAVNPAEAQEILTSLVSGISLGGQTITQEEARLALEDLFDTFDPARDTLDAWIATDTDQLVQVRLTIDDGGTDQVITINMTDYNSVETLEVPENAKTLLEITATLNELTEQLGGAAGDATQILDLPL